MNEADSVIGRMESDFKRANARAFHHFCMFRMGLDQSQRGRESARVQNCEFHLVNCKKHFENSDAQFCNNMQASLGLAQVAFFQKDWKTYTAKLSFLRNHLRNQVTLIQDAAGP